MNWLVRAAILLREPGLLRTSILVWLDDIVFNARRDEDKTLLYMLRTEAETRGEQRYDDMKMFDLQFKEERFEYIWVLRRIELLRSREELLRSHNGSRFFDAKLQTTAMELRGLYAREAHGRKSVVFDSELRRLHAPTFARFAQPD